MSVISGPVRLSGRRCQAISRRQWTPADAAVDHGDGRDVGVAAEQRHEDENSAAIPSGHSTSGSRCIQTERVERIRDPLGGEAPSLCPARADCH